MLKQLSVAALIGAFSLATVPAMAQGTGTEPPKAPTPSEAMKGGAMSKGGAMKGGAMKGGAMKGGAMKGTMKKKKM